MCTSKKASWCILVDCMREWRRQWYPLQCSWWKIPWTEEPGGLQSMGSLKVGHDWATSLSLFTFMHWRREWQPTPVLLPGEPQGWGSPMGCRLWGDTESDTIEATFQQQQHETKGDLWFTTPAVVSVISFTQTLIPTYLHDKVQVMPVDTVGRVRGKNWV